MRTTVLLALFALFYFASFPSLTIADLFIISFLAFIGIVLAAKTLFTLLAALVEEAYDAKIDSFVSRSWAKYRLYGFNKQMTYRLAKCFIVIVCVKYGFDVIKHAAEHVPSVAAKAFYAELAGVVLVLFFVIREGVWLKLASNFRRDTQGKSRLSFTTCYALLPSPGWCLLHHLVCPCDT
jgi:hypothetical protein